MAEWIETLPIQDAICTAQNTSELTTESRNFINELISSSQDIWKSDYKFQTQKSQRKKRQNEKLKLKSNYILFFHFFVSLNRLAFQRATKNRSMLPKQMLNVNACTTWSLHFWTCEIIKCENSNRKIIHRFALFSFHIQWTFFENRCFQHWCGGSLSHHTIFHYILNISVKCPIYCTL